MLPNNRLLNWANSALPSLSDKEGSCVLFWLTYFAIHISIFFLSKILKVELGIIIGNDRNRHSNLGSIFILTVSILPIKVRSRISHLSKSFLISFINFPYFASNNYDMVGMLITPKYLKPLLVYLKWSFKSAGHSPESIIATDLLSLITCPYISLYFSRLFSRAGIVEDGTYVIKSSANNDHLCSWPPSSLIASIYFFVLLTQPVVQIIMGLGSLLVWLLFWGRTNLNIHHWTIKWFWTLVYCFHPIFKSWMKPKGHQCMT